MEVWFYFSSRMHIHSNSSSFNLGLNEWWIQKLIIIAIVLLLFLSLYAFVGSFGAYEIQAN